MANQPEIDSYDTGVYQWEVTDPAQGGVGGVANAPLLNLANRTNWLKAAIASISSALANFATLASPPFSGTPTVPTAPAGDQSLIIANTAFAQRMYSGEAVVAIDGAGSMTLTQPQWGCGIIALLGALTGNRTIIFPNSGRWIVSNGTTVAFAVTCKTAAGGGVVITQGKVQQVWGDGINILPAHSDYGSLLNGTQAWTGENDFSGIVTVLNATAATEPVALGQFASDGTGYYTVPNAANPARPWIVQFGSATLPSGNGDLLTLPVAFPNALIRIIATDSGAGCHQMGWARYGSSTGSFLAYGMAPGTSSYQSTAYGYIAIGN